MSPSDQQYGFHNFSDTGSSVTQDPFFPFLNLTFLLLSTNEYQAENQLVPSSGMTRLGLNPSSLIQGGGHSTTGPTALAKSLSGENFEPRYNVC